MGILAEIHNSAMYKRWGIREVAGSGWDILGSMVKLIIWIVIGVLALSFFGISLQGLIDDPTTQANFDFIFDLVEQGWDIIMGYFLEAREWARNLIG